MGGVLVVGMVASPRKGMNTDTLVRRTLEGARAAGAETGLIYLNDLEVRPCQACPRPPRALLSGWRTILEIRGMLWSR
ncbi:MAG: NAD(P)H-dependent oxidoreductase [Bacillota bacterium]|nr:NAD(P)H-dependent oxidoreductase [Bacillota bacterium]